MWEFILEHKSIILLVSFVSFIIIYIFLKQDSSKKKIELAAAKQKEAENKDTEKKEVSEPQIVKQEIKEEIKQQPQQIDPQLIKEEKLNIQNTEQPRGDRQESLDNFKNERLKMHVLKLKPAVQAIILKK